MAILFRKSRKVRNRGGARLALLIALAFPYARAADISPTLSAECELFFQQVNETNNTGGPLLARSEDGLSLHPTDLRQASGAPKDVVPEEFMEWLKYEQAKPAPPVSVEDALRKYAKWRSDLTYSNLPGNQGIRPATPTFLRTFGRLSESESAYQAKMGNFYQTDTIYRGIPALAVPSDEEIVGHFARLSDNTTGMGVAPVLEEAKSRILQFNKDLFDNTEALENRVRKHVTGIGPEYRMSGFSSFSTDGSVATDFAAGRLAQPKFLAQMKAEIVIGMRRPVMSTVDTLGEAKVLRSENVIGESEVLITGAADPEAITTVKVYEVNGGDSPVLRMREAERISFDKVRLSEMNPRGRVLATSQWKIQADGSVTKISEEKAPAPASRKRSKRQAGSKK